MTKKRILTGDRPTGKLHLGHYFGSLQNRVQLQDKYETFVIVADWQALYDHLGDEKGRAVGQNVRECVLDNLAAGVNPAQATFFVQSEVPELAELTMIFQFLVTVARAKRNPTIKAEMISSGLVDSSAAPQDDAGWDQLADKINCGFLTFPISQAADILFCKADLVPVGEDQLPHIEQTREIARKFNRLFGETFPEPEGLVSATPRLRGLDGNAKMSKSLGNTINLSATPAEVDAAIKKAFSGEGHALGEYAELFGVDMKQFEKDGVVQMGKFKPALAAAINEFLEPMRARRAEWEAQPAKIRELLDTGRDRLRGIAQDTLAEVREKMGLKYKF